MMSAGSAEPVVIGIDLGTTATKVMAGTRSGELLHEVEHGYPLISEEPGEAVQDPAAVRDAAITGLVGCARRVREAGHAVRALSLSTAMHNLIGLDASGQPVTPVFTWADTRAAEVAHRLRAEADAADLHRATGTPVHTQSVMVKLAWLHQERPDLIEGVARWCALKDFVLAALVDEVVTEHSLASGSGLQDMASLQWSEPALRVAGITAETLPELRDPLDMLPLNSEIAERAGLPTGLPVVLGGGDGPLANLGVGAVEPGVLALSLGTSGALRVLHDRPQVDERCRTFSYALTEGLWVVGGAVSNGGVVGQWAAETFGMEVGELLDEARVVAPGADGLLALPYLLGERAPWWEPGLTGALIGLRRAHGRAEITRALVEGVAQQLALVFDAVSDTGVQVRSIRATGGALRSPVWSEVLAAALGLDVELTQDSGGSALGAVLLGWRALGELGSMREAASLVAATGTVRCDAEVAEAMTRRRPAVEQLYHALHAFDRVK